MENELEVTRRLPLDPVWCPGTEYEVRISGSELRAVLHTFAAEYEKGRGVYILEDLLLYAHHRLGHAIVRMLAEALADSRATTAATSADLGGATRIVRPLSGIPKALRGPDPLFRFGDLTCEL